VLRVGKLFPQTKTSEIYRSELVEFSTSSEKHECVGVVALEENSFKTSSHVQ